MKGINYLIEIGDYNKDNNYKTNQKLSINNNVKFNADGLDVIIGIEEVPEGEKIIENFWFSINESEEKITNTTFEHYNRILFTIMEIVETYLNDKLPELIAFSYYSDDEMFSHKKKRYYQLLLQKHLPKIYKLIKNKYDTYFFQRTDLSESYYKRNKELSKYIDKKFPLNKW